MWSSKKKYMVVLVSAFVVWFVISWIARPVHILKMNADTGKTEVDYKKLITVSAAVSLTVTLGTYVAENWVKKSNSTSNQPTVNPSMNPPTVPSAPPTNTPSKSIQTLPKNLPNITPTQSTMKFTNSNWGIGY